MCVFICFYVYLYVFLSYVGGGIDPGAGHALRYGLTISACYQDTVHASLTTLTP